MGRTSTSTSRTRDPREYQIVALSALLLLGIMRFGFEVPFTHVAVTLTSALAWQGLAARAWGRPSLDVAGPRSARVLPRFEWRSALISGLSLCLLVRARHPLWMALATLLAIGGKFVLRVPRADHAGSKHLLNPANGAIVLLLLAHAPVWVSPAQWGHHLGLALAVSGFGSLVVHRSARSDVTLAFLAAWGAVLCGRAALVHQAWAAPLHQLENGSLALYAFHMISDPRTTPDSRAGRIVFACLVALGAGFVQFVLFRTNGLLWSLAGASLVVPILDRVLPGRAFEWTAPGTGSLPREVRDASTGALAPAGAAGA